MEPRWLARVRLPAPNPPNNATLRVTRCEWATTACDGTSSAPRLNKRKRQPRRRSNVGASSRFAVVKLSAVRLVGSPHKQLEHLFDGYSSLRRPGELGRRQAVHRSGWRLQKKEGDGEIGKPNCYGMAVCAASAAVQDRDHRAARGCLPSRFGLQSSARRAICRLPVRSMVGRASLFWLDHLAITGLVPLPEPELPGLA